MKSGIQFYGSFQRYSPCLFRLRTWPPARLSRGCLNARRRTGWWRQQTATKGHLDPTPYSSLRSLGWTRSLARSAQGLWTWWAICLAICFAQRMHNLGQNFCCFCLVQPSFPCFLGNLQEWLFWWSFFTLPLVLHSIDCSYTGLKVCFLHNFLRIFRPYSF